MLKRVINTIVFVLLFCVNAYSQDVITLKNGTSIKAKVLRVDYNVEFRLWEESDGPVRTVPFGLLTSIKYDNGRAEVYPSAVFVDGDDLHDAASSDQLSEDYLKLILTPEEFATFSMASQVYSDARKSRTIGKWHIIPGAIMLGLGSFVAIMSKSDNEAVQKQTMAAGIVAAVGGTALLTIGVIRVAGKGKKMDQAEALMNLIANQYNERNAVETVSYSPTISFGATRNGLGFALNF